MVTAAIPLLHGLEAVKLAQKKGTLKVQLVMSSESEANNQ